MALSWPLLVLSIRGSLGSCGFSSNLLVVKLDGRYGLVCMFFFPLVCVVQWPTIWHCLLPWHCVYNIVCFLGVFPWRVSLFVSLFQMLTLVVFISTWFKAVLQLVMTQGPYCCEVALHVDSAVVPS